ncbi:MAG: cryptochrome/photolyase family protein, partial [Rhodobacteraceae bacterium]|nr:cryptochrome/photolyase family protein [Paracoccaceae bacterium]
MTRLHLVLGDQLSHSLSALTDLGADSVIVMFEVADEARYVPHHKQKIALILSAMRHFAETLRAAGHRVDYVALDDPANSNTFSGELARAVERHAATQVIVTEPGEWRVWQMMTGWQAALDVPVNIRPDTRFFCSRSQFSSLSQARKTSR